MVPENSQALFGPPGPGRAGPEWAEKRLEALAAWGAATGEREQGAVCDSWAYNVGIVSSPSYICSPKGGGRRRTESGASARAQGESRALPGSPPMSQPDKG